MRKTTEATARWGFVALGSLGGSLVLLTAGSLPACGGQPAARVTVAPVAPAFETLSAQASAAAIAAAPPASASGAPAASGAPPRDSSAMEPLPAPKRATIALSTRPPSDGSDYDAGAGDADLDAGDAAFERGDLAAAEAAYGAAKANGSKVPATVGLARVRIAKQGLPLDYAAAKGNAPIAAVARDLAKAVKDAPDFGPAFVELGRARLLLGDAPGALDALERGVALLPGEPEAHSQLGVASLATGHTDAAVRELARAAALDMGSAPRHGNLGTALLMSGRTKEAISEYELRARIDDGDPRAHSDLGTALLATNDLQRALAELTRATQIEPARASYHSNLGYALQQAGQLDRAIAEYREAIRLDPGLASAWINLATILARNPKTRAEARSALARAAAASPDDPRVKANLDELNALEKGTLDAGR
jgi:Flp pilus assembly protein TadD